MVDESGDQPYDVVVVGGGAAGLSGALALARARRSVLVIDSGEPRNAQAGHVHNYLTRDGTPPAELVALGRAEVARYGGEVVSGRVAEAVRDGDDGFLVTVDDGDGGHEGQSGHGGSRVRARRLLVATGVTDEVPDVPGAAQRLGRDVLHCPYCHGWEVRDQAIGVLASGPMSVHQALLFRQLSADVVYFAHTRPPTGDEAAQLAARDIRVVDGEVSALSIKDDRLTGVRLAGGPVVPRDVVVVATRMVARSDVLTGLGLDAVEHPSGAGEYIAADPTGRTEVPGVWVAGNITDLSAQVGAAAAAGAMAGAQINADLVTEEVQAAMAG